MHHVALELVAKIHRESHHLRDRFRIFAVHVENRNLQHPRDVGRSTVVERPLVRRRRETDLVIHDRHATCHARCSPGVGSCSAFPA